jgi:hypothetical protein
MFKVVGIEKLDYVSKKTNNRVLATNLYCISDDVAENLTGVKVEKFYVPSTAELPSGLVLNDTIKVYFNEFKGVAAVVKVVK